MTCHRPGCLGNYDFDRIAFFARKRFIDGCQTVALMSEASSECEKEEIALVSLLDIEEDNIRDIQLYCQHAEHCKLIDCRDKIKKLIEAQLTD
jgi:hypothetical protein